MPYRDHGEQNIAGGSSLEGGNGRVNERVDRRGGEYEASSKETDNLSELAKASLGMLSARQRTATW